jgi:hypothetical protein
MYERVCTIMLFDDFNWQSDWNGDEVGFDEVEVVSLMTHKKYPIEIYANSLTQEILEVWLSEIE